jgi:hypothetical protein
MKMKLIAIAAMFVALTGCNSFKVQQTNRFIDEDGNLISVQYGLLAKPHKTQFVSPVNGKTLDMESKLAVKVTLPDGGRFAGYQCMNMLRTGTMYKSSNEKWLFHANGTSCSVYLINEMGNDYLLVFNGILSEGSEGGPIR